MAFTWRRESDECHVKYGIGDGGVRDVDADAGRRHDKIDKSNNNLLKLK
jgi:hypothetical protein